MTEANLRGISFYLDAKFGKESGYRTVRITLRDQDKLSTLVNVESA